MLLRGINTSYKRRSILLQIDLRNVSVNSTFTWRFVHIYLDQGPRWEQNFMNHYKNKLDGGDTKIALHIIIR